MHVVHQLVLWLLRILGPRSSEPYGLLVEDFLDGGDEAALLLRAQGGRPFSFWGDQPGEVVTAKRKEQGKTTWAFRLVGVPYQLAELIRVVIAAFHTDPMTGEVDAHARLIPTLRVEESGQAGFRSALKRAGTASGVATDGDRLIPHDMRKALCVDFAWNDTISELLQRRWVGHRAGSDVFALVYTLDRRLVADLRPAVRALEQQLEAEIGTTLLTPTTQRPSYSRALDRDRLTYAAAVLAEAGWQVSSFGEEWVTAGEAAATLGASVTATRRLFPDHIAAVKRDGVWLARRDDVVAYRDRLAGWVRIEDLVERTQHEYHRVYRTIEQLGIEPHNDGRTRRLLLSDDQAAQIVGELDRVARLEERAVPVATAAKMLRAAETSVRVWANEGIRLTYDPESDGSGRRSVTRESITAELERRGHKPKQVVTAAELREYAGLDDPAIRALVRAGMLVRVRTAQYTVDSVRAWATGYSPDLLDTGLLPPT